MAHQAYISALESLKGCSETGGKEKIPASTPPARSVPSSGGTSLAGNISAPRAVYAPNPEYTEAARAAGLRGICELQLIVGPDGLPRDIKVVQSMGNELNQIAIEAVRQWRFEPALKDGKPVAVQIKAKFNFGRH